MVGRNKAVGVAVANAILFVTDAEYHRKKDYQSGFTIIAAYNRLRPILMTSLAMIAGMIPLSLGFGEGGDQTAPLGVAVIGGILFSTLSTLIFLPMVYEQVMANKPYKSPSLDPEDENSIYYESAGSKTSLL